MEHNLLCYLVVVVMSHEHVHNSFFTSFVILDLTFIEFVRSNNFFFFFFGIYLTKKNYELFSFFNLIVIRHKKFVSNFEIFFLFPFSWPAISRLSSQPSSYNPVLPI